MHGGHGGGALRLALLHAAAALAAAGAPSAVVLLGPSGSGKSETGNTLAGAISFRVSGGLDSETIVPSAKEAKAAGRAWRVVDTPGYFDTARDPEELADALGRFSDLLGGGEVAALAFVVPYGRFGDAHQRAWRLIKEAFGPRAMRHIVLVFTQCGERTEDQIREETGRMCAKSPPPTLCGVLDELGSAHGVPGVDRVVAFGELTEERKSRDRERLFGVAAQMETAAGGRGYDHREFLRARDRRKSMVVRIGNVVDPHQRRMLDMLLAGVEAGAGDERNLMRQLQEAEGNGETIVVTVDFEDGKLAPFSQIGTGWRQPIPMRYFSMNVKRKAREQFATASASGGGVFFLHTGTDSGVRLRQGEARVGEFRSAPFVLGEGPIRFEATGSGGYLAVCPAPGADDTDAISQISGCIERPLRERSPELKQFVFEEVDIAMFVGQPVVLRIVDHRTDGWAFIAVDNMEYPEMRQEGGDAVPAGGGVEGGDAANEPATASSTSGPQGGDSATAGDGVQGGDAATQQAPASSTSGPPDTPSTSVPLSHSVQAGGGQEGVTGGSAVGVQ